jgi:hypothetical protein
MASAQSPSTATGIMGLPSEALANVAIHLIPFSFTDGFVKFSLRSGAFEDAKPDHAPGAGQRLADLCHVSRRFAEAVRLGTGGRVQFVGPVDDNSYERDLLVICASLGPSVKELCLESVPDLSHRLISRLATHLTALESLYIYSSPALQLSSRASMSLAGLERLMRHFGPRITRLRIPATSCVDVSNGTCFEGDVKFSIGAALLQHCIRLERLVIDVGMFDSSVHDASGDDDCDADGLDPMIGNTVSSGVAWLAPSWRAVGLIEVASRLTSAMTDMSKIMTVLPRLYGMPNPEAIVLSRHPYNPSHPNNLLESYMLCSFWIVILTRSLYRQQRMPTSSQEIHPWVDPTTRAVMMRIESTNPTYFCDAMCSDSELDAMIPMFELHGESSGPIPTWLGDGMVCFSDCTVHREIVLDFIPIAD